jgi:hypothetical protein
MDTTTTTVSSSAPSPSATFLTRHRAHNSNLLWASTSAAGAGLCFLLLLVIAAVWMHPKSRKHLDRVSFRLVTTALICNMFYGIFSTIGGMSKGPSKTCGFSVFVLQSTLQMSTLLLYFIALNLQFVNLAFSLRYSSYLWQTHPRSPHDWSKAGKAIYYRFCASFLDHHYSPLC